MNKRQWKKKYKKEHGCNPPTARQVNLWMEFPQGSVNAIFEGFKKAFAEIKKDFDTAIDRIKIMPEGEFKEKVAEIYSRIGSNGDKNQK